ncbi:hypothetical protein JMN32_14700 [Fulvivirga sp. 29W222]|uniref:Rhamnosyl transferase n=1 Tax=Fulvivirga marina TaxID=2494733 RepID=A0A937FWQ6_9BACT|nr:glycosyltransferase [Fulvivirga marina]MBL6447565.1 hypothetical protein [Fulvivirga marina]
MNGIFTHIVITRFNIKNHEWLVDKLGKEVRTDQWMEHRIDLFKKICYPSLANQTVTNFKWVIFLDSDTKPIFRQQLEALMSRHSSFYIRYLNGIDEFNERLKDQIKPLIDEGSEYLITTRIDNDDAFRDDYIERIQQSFLPQELVAINFPKGLQWSIKNNQLFEVYNESNPFISLIEHLKRNSEILTVFHREHRHYFELGDFPLEQVSSDHLWLQAVHNNNVLNKIVGKEIHQPNFKELFNLKIDELC